MTCMAMTTMILFRRIRRAVPETTTEMSRPRSTLILLPLNPLDIITACVLVYNLSVSVFHHLPAISI